MGRVMSRGRTETFGSSSKALWETFRPEEGVSCGKPSFHCGRPIYTEEPMWEVLSTLW